MRWQRLMHRMGRWVGVLCTSALVVDIAALLLTHTAPTAPVLHTLGFASSAPTATSTAAPPTAVVDNLSAPLPTATSAPVQHFAPQVPTALPMSTPLPVPTATPLWPATQPWHSCTLPCAVGGLQVSVTPATWWPGQVVSIIATGLANDQLATRVDWPNGESTGNGGSLALDGTGTYTLQIPINLSMGAGNATVQVWTPDGGYAGLYVPCLNVAPTPTP